MAEKYSQIDELTAFGFMISAMSSGKDGDGDTGNPFPRSDAEDLSRGCRFIPGEVTLARRRGEKVQFVSSCGPNCWYWQMPDGSRIYHYDPGTAEEIRVANGGKRSTKCSTFKNGLGPCPKCGNPHTSGGTVRS